MQRAHARAVVRCLLVAAMATGGSACASVPDATAADVVAEVVEVSTGATGVGAAELSDASGTLAHALPPTAMATTSRQRTTARACARCISAGA